MTFLTKHGNPKIPLLINLEGHFYLGPMCAILDLTIVNGTIDNSGNFTYISTHGNSLIDYIIVSPELCKLFSYFSIQCNVLSPHMPIEATLCSVTVAEDPYNIPTEYRSV